MTTPLLPAVELETAADPQWAVLWLHGLGADGHDFEPIVPELVRPHWPALRFVFPHAPVRPVTVNNGLPMRAWYDIAGFDFAHRADPAGLAESVAQAEALIAREAERGIAPKRLLLAGFSQGGAVALSLALKRARPLAGLVALSTYLPGSAGHEATPQAPAQPVFMAHGIADPVIPVAESERSRQALAALGFDVEWHRYPMAHQVYAEEIADLGQWMERRFAEG